MRGRRHTAENLAKDISEVINALPASVRAKAPRRSDGQYLCQQELLGNPRYHLSR
jgi:hypothetical protein